MGARTPADPRAAAVLLAGGAAIGAAYSLGSPQLLAIGLALLALLAACALLVFAGRGLPRVLRRVPDRPAHVGDRVELDLGLRGALLPPGTEVRDLLSPGLAPAPDPAPTAERQRRYSVTALSRGAHRIGPVRLTVADPFGLFRRVRYAGETHILTVLPRLVPVPEVQPLLARGAEGAATRSAPRPGTGEDDLVSRPYHRGDSIRRVNWRATAHRDELMVRQEEPARAPRALLLIDTHAERWVAGPRNEEEAVSSAAFERGVSLLASAALVLSDAGYRCRLLAAGYAAVPDARAGSIPSPAASGSPDDPEEGSLDRELGPHDRGEASHRVLLALAHLRPEAEGAELPGPDAAVAMRAPDAVIAVLGRASAADIAPLLRLPHGLGAGGAIALLPAGAPDATLWALEHAGWRCTVGTPGAVR